MAVNNEPGGKKSVRVLMRDGTVATREVGIGMNDGVHVQIRDGLQVGEKVITGLLSQDEIKTQSRRRRLGPF
jgi:hypothetical protein